LDITGGKALQATKAKRRVAEQPSEFNHSLLATASLKRRKKPLPFEEKSWN